MTQAAKFAMTAVITASAITSAFFNSAPAHAQLEELKSDRCNDKLGVHRTIQVSTNNAFLVGVDNHARLGLRPKELILTFDDGPREGTTEPILEALENECVKATFFSLGRAARAAPDLLKRVAREGHTVASHTQSHPQLTKHDSETVRAEVRRGLNSVNIALEGSGFEASNFFRYPFLDRSKRTDAIVKSFGLVAFHMNIDSWDWRNQTPQEMLELTLQRVRGERSGVVLFHDIQKKTAIALPEFLRVLRQEGYKIVHVVPGPSNFDYQQDLVSRIPPPRLRPVKLAKVETASADNDVDVLVDAPPIIPSITAVQPASTKLSTVLPSKQVGAVSSLDDTAQQRPERLKNLKKPLSARVPKQAVRRQARFPSPKRKPKFVSLGADAPLDLGLRGSHQPISTSESVDRGIQTQSIELFDATLPVATLPTAKKRKSRFGFRKLFGRKKSVD